KYAYFPVSELNLSAYQKVTFWLKNEVAVTANQWKLCLCSDTAGDTVVDSFDIQAIPSTTTWIPFTIARSGGGNLGSSIRSIALYSGSSAPTASKYLRLDNINACSANGLNLQSLISKSGNAVCGDESWWCIQSINGATLLLDQNNGTKSTEGRGYSGTSETVTTYKRETVKTSIAMYTTTNIQTVQAQGVPSIAWLTFSFGWDTSTTEQNGETFFDGVNGLGTCLYLQKPFVKIDRLSCTRYYCGLNLYNVPWHHDTIGNIVGCSLGIQMSGVSKALIYGYVVNQCSTAFMLSSAYDNNIFVHKAIANSNSVNFTISNGNRFFSILLSNNAGNGSLFGGTNTLVSPTILDAVIGNSFTVYSDGELRIIDENGVAGANRILTYNAYLTWQTAVKHESDPGAWEWKVDNGIRSAMFPGRFKIAEVAVNAGAQVKVTCWMKNIVLSGVAKLMTPDNPLIGVTYTSVQKASADNEWENVTLQFTPAKAGVAEIYLDGYYDTAYLHVYVGSISIQQA
ncbi:MAG TPA: hypothetical protein PLP88_13280, partial [Bacteroidales bacterium]|nr:hypothetical protein [Bacteroidales bacterium]